ncbi:MAG: Gfo/Idh/MocA family oxidoreductase [Phycisphaerales bacterium]|nr:Gfo/Idh/MocA family oxidoreductase [Planctomycetota bacterium]MCH8508331.1 Gfo/Idh/MocA family oxidoreductase [Phycisphaerales bacterium]
MSKPVGIGIIGMGFMGQTHTKAFTAAAAAGHPCVIRAVCDRDPGRRAGKAAAVGNIKSGAEAQQLFDPVEVAGHADPADLLADPSIELVSICTHTDTHVDLAIQALDAGKHVLVEKPVAVTVQEVERLAARVARSGRLCIPAMCIRHWPGWADLRAMIASGEQGQVVHARFERLGAPPAWAGDFYADPGRSGGAIFDLHVHDADFALSLFGKPASVSSIGDAHHIATQMHYPGGPAVATEGGWLNDRSFPFRMAFVVEFERAVVAFDSSRDPAMVLHTGGQSRTIDLPGHTGYDAQARAVVDAIANGRNRETLPTIADALAVTRLIEAERTSAAEGRPIDINW